MNTGESAFRDGLVAGRRASRCSRRRSLSSPPAGAPLGITLTDIEAARVYHDQNGTGITISPDHKQVTLDAELSATSLANGAKYTTHLTGTITCP